MRDFWNYHLNNTNAGGFILHMVSSANPVSFIEVYQDCCKYAEDYGEEPETPEEVLQSILDLVKYDAVRIVE